MFKSVPVLPDFCQLEKDLLDKWYKKGIVTKYLKKNSKSKKIFSFQDGPITANNPMGVHHAWGRTYKDIWQRFFNLLDHKQRFQNGFDCQGLWVEVEVEKELKLKNKKDIENLIEGDKIKSVAKFVDLCKARVKKYASVQTDQSKRLGYFMDWDNSYFTMTDDNNYMIWHFLKVCFDNGWIYKGHESVPWCPRCETAISQHEMLTEDYKELTHDSVYIKFKILNSKFKIANIAEQYLLVWTTTPWTIPANIAIAVDVKLDYSLIENEKKELFWVATESVDRIFKNKKIKTINTAKGDKLVGLKYQAPFDDIPAVKKVASANPDTFHKVIATDDLIMPITTTEGTGMVHTAVSAGVEDFKLGKKLGLPYINVISDNADYLPEMGWLAGKNAKKHPQVILDHMKDKWCYLIEKYTHRYPACWRCKTELVWKIADEWYIAMDKKIKKTNNKKQDTSKNQFKINTINNNTFRERMIKVVKQIKWMPEFGLERELDWLSNMHDWLISKKNRYWGLALPIYECKKCNHFEVIGSKQELKKRAVEGWNQFEGKSPHKPYIDLVKIKCRHCNSIISRIDDVGNPWLDAGIVPFSTVSSDNKSGPLYIKNNKQWQQWYPADFITESFPGQFKNWFYALIAMATALEDSPPFKTVLGFGTLLGEDGRPMHKSWGNAIEFNEGADKIGVDVMRWMYAGQNPSENMLFGYHKANDVRRNFYLIFWNCYRYFIEQANLNHYHMKSAVSNKMELVASQNILDAWILYRLNYLINLVKNKLISYQLKDTSGEIEAFVNDLSTWYIRRSRARTDKDTFLTTLHFVLVNLAVIVSPILPFISDEIYTNLTGNISVHLSTWPDLNKTNKLQISSLILTDMQTIRDIVEVGNRIRKENGIKSRQPLLSAQIQLTKSSQINDQKYLDKYLDLIKDELNIKKIKIEYTQNDKINVIYDLKLTPELIAEGQMRDLVRTIQQQRKKMGLSSDQKIKLILPDYPLKFEKEIKNKVNAIKLKKGDKFQIIM